MDKEMIYSEFALHDEGFINRFITTKIYTDTQTYPSRGRFTEKRKNETPPYVDISKYFSGQDGEFNQEEELLELYLPYGSKAVDRSNFYHLPSYLRSYYCCILHADKDRYETFILSTCGGMTLWVNDTLITDFIPYVRNKMQTQEVIIFLKAGINKLIICLDDFAERDTAYAFRMKVQADHKLKILLPAKAIESENPLVKIEEMLTQVHFNKDVYISEYVLLKMENHLEENQLVKVTVFPSDHAESMNNLCGRILQREYTVSPGADDKILFHSDIIPPAFYYFEIEIHLSQMTVKRKLAVQIIRERLMKIRSDYLVERKQQGAEAILSFGTDNVYKAAVMLFHNQSRKEAEDIIFNELKGISAEKEYSCLHLAAVIFIYQKFYPSINSQLKDEIEKTMLEYPYWLDKPGNEERLFSDMNQALFIHICGLFAGGCLPERKFKNDGLTGARLYKTANQHLEKWFDDFLSETNIDWNLNSDISVTVTGLCILHELVNQEDKYYNLSKMALDRIFKYLCIYAHKGIISGCMSKILESGLVGNYNDGTSALLYIAYNKGYLNGRFMSYALLSLSEYEPPPVPQSLLQLDRYHRLIYHKKITGIDDVNVYLYRNYAVSLSTAIGFRPFNKGFQEQIVQAAIDGIVKVFINHPGENQTYANENSDFWVGNGILPMAMQYENTSILKYDIPDEHETGFTHAYIPIDECDEYFGNSYTFAIAKNNGYIGIKSQNVLELQKSGVFRYREFISKGRQNIWVVRVGVQEEYGSFMDFYRALKNICIANDQDGTVIVKDDQGLEYLINEQNDCYINGKILYHDPLGGSDAVNIQKISIIKSVS